MYTYMFGDTHVCTKMCVCICSESISVDPCLCVCLCIGVCAWRKCEGVHTRVCLCCVCVCLRHAAELKPEMKSEFVVGYTT